jgi:hypothetical protein
VYPVRYEADFVLEQDRLKTIFRWIIAIPWFIVGSVYGLAASVVGLLAWFAIVFTGRYPQGLYNFNAGFLRFYGRTNAFYWLQTDEWPSFGLEDDPSYPARVQVDPPLPKYNRWKTGFRLILGIPVMFMASYLFATLLFTAAAIAWFHITFTGRTSGGIHNAITAGIAYTLRSMSYLMTLNTETLPPISDQQPAANYKRAPAALPKSTTAKAAAKPAAKRASAAKAPARKPTRKPPAKKAGTTRTASRSTTRKPATKKKK